MTNQKTTNNSTVRVVRVFLASPGDLADERRKAREAIEEINKTVARPAKIHVDLIGWEDTLSSAGRPQAIINEDLDTCQMFIGMLGARWGTPPDNEGKYSSGFEEEFQLASSRNDKTGEPHLTLFFKEINEENLIDPGKELTKVLEFKNKTISTKKILYDSFIDPEDVGKKIRLSVAQFIHKLVDNEIERQPSAASIESNEVKEEKIDDSSSSLQKDSKPDIVANFLEKTATVFKASEVTGLNQFDIARLRNIAAAYQVASNDEVSVGVHDANILYQNRKKFDYTNTEVTALADAGVQAFSEENKPLWSWLADRLEGTPDWLTLTTLCGPDIQRIGAFRVMDALNMSVIEKEGFDADRLYPGWFGEEISDSVKNAALEYIASRGVVELTNFAEEQVDENNFNTRKAALQAVVSLRGRNGSDEAAKYALETSFDDIGRSTLSIILSGMEKLDSETLKVGLEHRSGEIRAKAINVLSAREDLREEEIRRFFGDSSVNVRESAVSAFERNFRPLSYDEAKEALVIQSTRKGLLGGYDHKGNQLLKQHKQKRLKRKSLSDLETLEITDPLHAEDYYFAKIDASFSKYSKILRSDIDDQFGTFWQEFIARIEENYGSASALNSLLDTYKKNESFHKRMLLRRALDILIAQSESQDLQRVRKIIDDDLADPRELDISYFGRWGEWEDIIRIAKISEDYRANGEANSALGGLLAYSNIKSFVDPILKICGDRINDLLELDLTPRVYSRLIASIPINKFININEKKLVDLLNNEDDSIRKFTSLQILNCLGVRKSKRILKEYMDPTKHRYYNVIYWLDLCEAWKKGRYRPIVKHQLKTFLD